MTHVVLIEYKLNLINVIYKVKNQIDENKETK